MQTKTATAATIVGEAGSRSRGTERADLVQQRDAYRIIVINLRDASVEILDDKKSSFALSHMDAICRTHTARGAAD